MKIRLANIEDASQILSIYSQYIDTNITFEYKLPTLEEFKNRIENIIEKYPYLVCEDDSKKIIGYCYANKFLEREAYNWSCELSIYLDKNNISRGIGKKLCSIIIEILKYQGIKNIYSKVTVPNTKSDKLHYSLGFNLIGNYNNIGYKNGKWHSVSIFEKELIFDYDNPKDIIPIKEINEEKIISFIENYK
ncbi:Sortase related acyltransferase [Brachyspira hampsonii 30446]|uniref:Sortase related acyltransferase n=2 Tax=Brachyspira hampsonii TaxID=1287055 RepID=A0A2U4FMU0_9SPIR|nr:GNAT family N-acetyltransferase [Brachyspira hampsonii]EKV56453.1 Sortase related acyltransferase [Brachyspira hampsonii 30446]MBW5396045.1 N-acetyltransferase family protein [Brachyspira hampsonii]OEJ20306.1 phosphinothricin acetyltransferase [Brachyspira hampsonii]